MQKKVAVVLGGCGFKDGTEITEAVSVIVSLSELGAELQFFAPDREFVVKNNITAEPTGEKRNMLIEAARIARGKILPIAKLHANDFDAVVFPGGFGAATNLCTFAMDGAKGSVLPEIEKVIHEFHKQSKPIGGVCIAPAILALALGKVGVSLTVGEDGGAAANIKKTGADHVVCAVDDFVSDRANKVVTTPAYMYEAKPHQVFKGIRLAMQELYEMA